MPDKFNPLRTAVLAIVSFAAVMQPPFCAIGQKADLMQKLQEIKATSAANKVALSHYTWQETRTTSLKGQVRKTQTFQVTMGPDGQQQKTEIGGDAAAASAPAQSGGRFKQRMIAKKKEEYQEYGEQMAALAKQYTQPDPQLMQQAYQRGNITAQLGGAAGTVSLVIKSYVKPGDSMTLNFNRTTKSMESIQVATYLSAPGDAMTMAVAFAKLPSGPSHVATVQINGISKELAVHMQNSNYQSAR